MGNAPTEVHREFKGKCREIQKIDGEVKKWIEVFRREVIKHTERFKEIPMISISVCKGQFYATKMSLVDLRIFIIIYIIRS